MKDYHKEIIKFTAREVLLTLFDITTPFQEASRIHRSSILKLKTERAQDRKIVFERIKYLKRHGLIKDWVKGKKGQVELTPKGLKRIQEWRIEDIEIEKEESWDRKWRMVIFDIPEKYKSSRDALRHKLVQLNFVQVQKSIYVFPYACTDEISLISKRLLIDKYVLITIADIIQGEENIVEKFIENKVLDISELKKNASV